MTVRDGNLTAWLAEHHFDVMRHGDGSQYLTVHIAAGPELERMTIDRDHALVLRRAAIKGLRFIRDLAEKHIAELE